MKQEAFDFLNQTAQIIYDKKGVNILALEVVGDSCLAEYLLIAEGNVERHVSSIALAILKNFSQVSVRTEGLESGDWIVLDFSNVVVHLFRPGLRERYAIEKLATTGSIVDLKIRL